MSDNFRAGLSIDRYGRVAVSIDPPGAEIVFEFTPAEMRQFAEKLLDAAIKIDATTGPIVEAALAKARGQVQ